MNRLALALLVLVGGSWEQNTPISPCANVFMYEPSSTEPGRWYGVVNLSTDSTLHSLWLNIVLDSKADILGNWVGDVTTTDNIDFKIENTKMKIHPGPAQAVRFFVQYNPLNKPPKLQTIRLNGREICNANNRQPAVDRPDTLTERPSRETERPVSRPDSSSRPRPETRPDERPVIRPDDRPVIRPEDRPQTKPVFGRPVQGESPVYVPTQNPPIEQSNVNPYSINGQGSHNVASQTGSGRPGHQVTPSTPIRTTTDRIRDEDDFDDSRPSDYFTGERPTFVVPSVGTTTNNYYPNNNNPSRGQGECGKVIRNNPNPLVVGGKPTLEGQWPWQIALYQTQTVDNKYICGGTLVSHKQVITAAHCITRKGSNRVVNKNTLTVYLGKHNLRTSVEGVQIRLVGEITVHPQYNASAFSRDVGILTLREPVTYTDFVRPACLWPENQIDLSNVIGKKGSVVGWGFDDTGVATEELTLVEMPVVDQETCIRSYSEFFARFTSEYTYCAGYRDGTSVCNGDSGGGMVFNLQNTWYLRGLVSLSVARQNEYRCDPTHYVVFTDLAKFLPWIQQYVTDY
ncbi:serine protease gd-like isoform X2 [Pectinophora gossypiella]|uniref:serine protease gd-like isoform X2 n=1 Tax=Pectinophora gossypiella TaxID=13191 RepID=UPI00214EFBD4|nr:serine protease gd-like isoform X2 [Pectinophora gossypiella]